MILTSVDSNHTKTRHFCQVFKCLDHLNTELYKVWYSDESGIRMSGVQMVTVLGYTNVVWTPDLMSSFWMRKCLKLHILALNWSGYQNDIPKTEFLCTFRWSGHLITTQKCPVFRWVQRCLWLKVQWGSEYWNQTFWSWFGIHMVGLRLCPMY